MSDGVTMPEMIAVCLSEAQRIDTTQSDLVAVGLRTVPAPDQLQRIRVFEAIIHLIDLVRGDPIILKRLKGRTTAERTRAESKNRGSESSARVAGSGGR